MLAAGPVGLAALVVTATAPGRAAKRRRLERGGSAALDPWVATVVTIAAVIVDAAATTALRTIAFCEGIKIDPIDLDRADGVNELSEVFGRAPVRLFAAQRIEDRIALRRGGGITLLLLSG
ncbi:MAG TPA: hypothetical protein VHV31_13650 [Nitrolancea sp.]|nr:hypothetical protein [Nitrolancea sp.]